MKKIITLITIMAMMIMAMFTFSACGNKEEAATEEVTNEAQTEETTEENAKEEISDNISLVGKTYVGEMEPDKIKFISENEVEFIEPEPGSGPWPYSIENNILTIKTEIKLADGTMKDWITKWEIKEDNTFVGAEGGDNSVGYVYTLVE